VAALAAELVGARDVLFWLLLGGFVWVVGDLFQQYAAKYVGISRGIPLSNTNQLWGLAWGLLVFGELMFLLVVSARGRDTLASGQGDVFSRRFVRVVRWSLIASVVSWLAWFAAAASVMSGSPLAALDGATLAQVLFETQFGRIFALRLGLAIALATFLTVFPTARRSATRSSAAVGVHPVTGASASASVAGALTGALSVAFAVAFAVAYLAALAWAGHAAAIGAAGSDVEIVADATHIVAAGAWLGALPAFVFLLRRTDVAADALAATRRFSTLAAACVGLLTASGIANAWFLVGDVPALVGTLYGRLLLAKLALFALMLALAIANRWYLTRRLAEGAADACRLLRRNASAEILAGLVILAIVGVLGVTPPAIHETPMWPFTHTLTFAPAEQSPWLLTALVAAGLMAVVCAGLMVAAIRRHRLRQSLGSLAAIVVLAAIFLPLLATRAYPSTYWASPIPYTTDAIVAGARVYAVDCRECHGLYRLDDAGPSRQSMAPARDPTEHALRHRDGEHYWWIAHGIPGTSMPAFGARLSDDDIWNVIAYLNAQVEAEEALAMTDRIKPLRAIVAPDFAFESADRPQESLRQLRGKAAVLLVLYTLPQSAPRLQELAAEVRSFAAGGARVIAAPIAESAGAALGLPDDVGNALSTADATVAAAYALFTHQSAGAVVTPAASPAATPAATPAHAEFLIDRDGYLRARWIGTGDGMATRTAEALDRLAILRRETPLPEAPWGHRHR
jgi:putative copper resistance protein D